MSEQVKADVPEITDTEQSAVEHRIFKLLMSDSKLVKQSGEEMNSQKITKEQLDYLMRDN